MIKGAVGQQLRLFMTGTELQGAITQSIDRTPGGTMEGLWKRKLKESKRDSGHGSGVYESLRQRGWQGEGPGITHTHIPGAIPDWDRTEVSVDDAHHRIAAAADMERRGIRTFHIPTVNQWEYRRGSY